LTCGSMMNLQHFPRLSAIIFLTFPHQHNVKWFGCHGWTTQQLWTATLIVPDFSKGSQIGWVQSDELSGAPRRLHQCSLMFWKLWSRTQQYPEECMVVFEMLQNQTIRICKFRSYWEYWPYLQDYSSASRTWSLNIR
jgi:hypothetical protein